MPHKSRPRSSTQLLWHPLQYYHPSACQAIFSLPGCQPKLYIITIPLIIPCVTQIPTTSLPLFYDPNNIWWRVQVMRLATGWTVRGSNPGGGRFSAPVQTGHGAHPASYTTGTGSFSGVKRPGRGAEHPPPPNAQVKERVELFICSPIGPSWPVLRWTSIFYLLASLSKIHILSTQRWTNPGRQVNMATKFCTFFMLSILSCYTLKWTEYCLHNSYHTYFQPTVITQATCLDWPW
jgi:hypothetical protein